MWALNMGMLLGERHTQEGMPVEFVTPYYGGNQNLAAQKGLFSHWISPRLSFADLAQSVGKGPEEIEIVERICLKEKIVGTYERQKRKVTHNLIKEFQMPSSEAPALRRLLCESGYTTSRVFPSYNGVVDQMLNDPTD
ncbi:hypothetical protein [Rhodovulum sp. ES.010]|uniref:hypothetical protein n=1 Tax=Rhodovulum sp. ES.010 TaxID=1882821 RepID=UPI0011150F2D|nr:hypothetical protein [Rhodovulum sp. ES.010]